MPGLLTDLVALLDWNELIMQSKSKVLVATLSLSAAAFIGLVSHEGYTSKAIIPTQGDVPTVGFGSTYHEDGSRVKLGDSVNPVNALKKAQAHITKEEALFRKSLPDAYLTQAEYDIYMDFVYQYGIGKWQKSEMRKQILNGQHVAACNALLRYRFADDFDCSTPGNKRCMGVWTRQQERHAACMAAQ